MRLRRMQKVTAVLLAAGLAVPLTAGSTLVQAKQPQQKSESHVNDRQRNHNDSFDQTINEIQKGKLVRWQQFYRQKALIGKKQYQNKATKNRAPQTAKPVTAKTTKPHVTTQTAKPVVEQTTKPAARKSSAPVRVKPAAVKQPVVTKKATAAVKPAGRQPAAKSAAKQSTANRRTSSSWPSRQQSQAAVQKPAPVRQAAAKPAVRQNQSRPAAHPVQHPQATASAQSFVVTAYALNGRTATGVNLKANSDARVVAVDPSVIPLGSKVTIDGLGTYTAADTGGAIKGKRIDVHMSSNQQAVNFGRRTLHVTVQH